MASAIGSTDKHSVNVELNIVPFIDLMSCMTAFLLVTAVWINLAQLDTRAGGRARDDLPPNDDPKLSVLLASDGIWVGVSRVNDFEHVPNTAAGYDWPALAASLRAHKASALFANQSDIELAADSTKAHPVVYQHLVAAMDVAVKSGFVDVGITEPAALSAQPIR